jgi:hypothetical protein
MPARAGGDSLDERDGVGGPHGLLTAFGTSPAQLGAPTGPTYAERMGAAAASVLKRHGQRDPLATVDALAG